MEAIKAVTRNILVKVVSLVVAAIPAVVETRVAVVTAAVVTESVGTTRLGTPNS
jgi:hypothetical protein